MRALLAATIILTGGSPAGAQLAIEPQGPGALSLKIAFVDSGAFGGAGLGPLLERLGVQASDLTQEVAEGSLDLTGYGLLIIGSMVTADAGFKQALDSAADGLQRFVREGGYLIQLSQADQNEATVKWLPEGLSARRCDDDYSEVVVRSPDHNLLSRPNPVSAPDLARLRLEPAGGASWPVVWECFLEVAGWEIIAARTKSGKGPCLVEAQYGQGRFLLSSISPDKLFVAGVSETERWWARALMANMLAHAQAVAGGKARPVVVTPAPALAEVIADWPRWPAEAPDDPFDAQTVGRRPDGSVMVPTGQIITPAGLNVTFPGRPTDLAVSPDGRTLAVADRLTLILINLPDGKVRQTLRVSGAGHSYCGLLWSADGRRLFSSDTKGRVQIAELDDSGAAKWGEAIAFEAGDPAKSLRGKSALPAGLALSADGSRLYAALNGNNALAMVDLASRTTVAEVPVGFAPYGVVLAGENRAYVSNWGGRRATDDDPTAPGPGGRIVVDERTGVAASGTVSVVDLGARAVVKTIEVGLHPSGMALGARFLFVANANSDTVSVIDTVSDEVTETIDVAPEPDMPFGSAPNALALSPDGTRLYVANGGNNAICVVEPGRSAGNDSARAERSRTLGFIPVGWYPGAVALSADAKTVYVANTKGLGSLNPSRTRDGHNSHDHLGSVSLIAIPDAEESQAHTEVVVANNRLPRSRQAYLSPREGTPPAPVPQRVGEPSVFEHVLYIIKENRTYDQVFGDLPQGNSDPDLCIFGREVTPNHHKLAEEFVLLDNVHCSGILSADGHQWTDEAYVTDYLEKAFGAFPRSYPYEGGDPLAYASSGFIWDNALANGLTFRDYGEMVHAAIEPRGTKWEDIYADYVNGTNSVKITAEPGVETLRPHLCPTFVGFPGIVPDVWRAREFIRELEQFEAQGSLPNLMVMLLPNDHTMGTRPGVPTPRAQVADNDLALGQIVHALSHSEFWPTTAVFVTEDDPQAGFDHVDGHRTVGLVISPYTKRGVVDSTNYNQISMVRTIEQILGLPPMNQFDATATPMASCFAAEPDLSPYEHVPNRIPLDELNPARETLSGPALYWAQKSLELPLDDIDQADEDTFNRIIWHSVKGYDVPYPELPAE